MVQATIPLLLVSGFARSLVALAESKTEEVEHFRHYPHADRDAGLKSEGAASAYEKAAKDLTVILSEAALSNADLSKLDDNPDATHLAFIDATLDNLGAPASSTGDDGEVISFTRSQRIGALCSQHTAELEQALDNLKEDHGVTVAALQDELAQAQAALTGTNNDSQRPLKARFIDLLSQGLTQAETLEALSDYALASEPGLQAFADAANGSELVSSSDDDLEVDSSPIFSRSDTGVWVSAWIFVTNEDGGEPAGDEDREIEGGQPINGASPGVLTTVDPKTGEQPGGDVQEGEADDEAGEA